jgi:D-alanyl-D-alanine dipeptidase
MNDDFVFVDEYVAGIYWDTKYATWGNFTRRSTSTRHRWL